MGTYQQTLLDVQDAVEVSRALLPVCRSGNTTTSMAPIFQGDRGFDVVVSLRATGHRDAGVLISTAVPFPRGCGCGSRCSVAWATMLGTC